MKDFIYIFFVLLFWGIESNNIIFSIILFLFLGFPLIINSKNKFSFFLFKFASLITYFLLFIVLYYYFHNNIIFFLGGLLKWSPLILLPIITLELYSYDKKTPIKAILIFANYDNNKIKILYYYIFIVVLATSSEKTDLFFYIFIAIFFSVLLFSLKPKKYNFIIWIFTFLLLMFSAFIVQNGVSNLHKKLVDSLINFFMGIDSSGVDISKSSTRIGRIGKLKLSNEIIYRLKADLNNYPLYLREATYTKYYNGDWTAPESKFISFNENLCPNKFKYKDVLRASLFGEFKKESILPLHTRLSKVFIKNKKEKLSKNSLMVIKRDGNETNSITFEYYKDNISCLDKKFTYDDLKIPKNELKYIKLFLKRAKLNSKTPEMEVLSKLEKIFNTEYKYSLNIKNSKKARTALGYFLLYNKAGHCEYFATATTLILRELGIPARYTTGYSVQEYSDLEKDFIIRKRHAHAWVRVLINKNWYNFDTTPASWVEIENKNFSFYYKIYDFLSYIRYKFKSSWFWRFIKSNYAYSIIILILIFIIIRYKNRKKRYNKEFVIKKTSKVLKKIDRVLKKKGLLRDKDVPFEIWLNNLEERDRKLINYTILNEIINQYYIIRFSDKEMSENSLKIIYKKIKKWKKLK